jgi:DNA-binding MurR/RpiR family transcriptional regulator
VDADGIKNTALAPVCLADYLCNAVAVQLGDAALRRMQKLETLFREHEILGN